VNTPVEQLCLGYPEEVATYMSYCRNLGFDETPNYAYLRRLFKELYNKCCFEHDFIYDWTIQRYRLEIPLQYNTSQEEHKVDGKSTLPDSMKGNGGSYEGGVPDNRE